MPAEAPPSIVRRTTLFVHNIKRSILFYEAVFGLHKYHERHVSMEIVPAFPVQTQGQGGDAKLVIMRGKDSLYGMVGLIEMRNPPLPETKHDIRRLGYGSAALVLSTNNAEAAASMVEPMGGTLLSVPTNMRNIGDEEGNVIPAKVFMAFDPDGYFLEVFQPTE